MPVAYRTVRLPETCWTRKTPLQVGLLLTLCVTVPFFIGMVIVYSLSFTVGRHSDRCYRMCAVLWDWEMTRNRDDPTDYGDVVDFETTSEKSVRLTTSHLPNPPLTATNATTTTTEAPSSSSTTEKSSNRNLMPPPNPPPDDKRFKRTPNYCYSHKPQFPQVGALLHNFYVDDQEKMMLKCPVAVVAPNWVLTIDECLNDHQESLAVRINSDNWSTGGILKKIQKFIKFNRFVALRLVQGDDEECFAPLDLACEAPSPKGKILFWNSDLQRALKKRAKYEPIQTVGVVFDKTGDTLRFEGDDTDGVGQIGAPVLAQNGSLVGFQLPSSGTAAKQRVEYKSLKKFCDWSKLGRFLS